MKTIYRSLVLGILMTIFVAAAATTGYAQEACAEVEPKAALDKEFRDNWDNKDIAKREIAVKAGKQYIEKYGACPNVDKDFVQYLKDAVPVIEEGIVKEKKLATEKIEGEKRKALYTRFDAAVKGTNNVANPAETYAAGKEIAALNNDFLLDVLLVLGSAGYDQAVATTPVDTYNNETIEYAKMAIQKLEANATSKTGNFGVYQYSYKNDKLADGKPNPNGFADGKSNALGAMNYNIGYILYYRQGKDNPAKKKEALPYLYKSTQYNSFAKKNPTIYQTIGAWYLDEALRIDKERAALVVAAGNKDTDETLAMVGLQKGYADRAIDAYARAYKLAKDDKNQKKEYTDGLYSRLKDLYAFRYDGKTEGIDGFVASVQSKPMPDPTAPITPVKDETPTTTPVTTSTTTETKPATTPTKPVSVTTTTTTTTKPAATTVSTTTTTKTKPVKKPAPKKRGTR